MNPQTSSASGSGFSQPGSDMGQLPPIHAPESFHAPDAQMPHFAAAPGAQMPAAPSFGQPAAPTSSVVQSAQSSSTGPATTPTQVALDVQAQALAQAAPAAPAEEPDTAVDEEWVGKARQVVQHLHTDPFLESKELSKLKAQYVKARYNKDIKVNEG